MPTACPQPCRPPRGMARHRQAGFSQPRGELGTKRKAGRNTESPRRLFRTATASRTPLRPQIEATPRVSIFPQSSAQPARPHAAEPSWGSGRERRHEEGAEDFPGIKGKGFLACRASPGEPAGARSPILSSSDGGTCGGETRRDSSPVPRRQPAEAQWALPRHAEGAQAFGRALGRSLLAEPPACPPNTLLVMKSRSFAEASQGRPGICVSPPALPSGSY